MARIIHCPSCQVELTIPDGAEGKRLKCPQCASRFPIPGVEARTPSQRPAEAAKKKVKVPPSSGTVSSSRQSADDLPLLPVDFSGLDEIPLLGELRSPGRPGSSNPSAADVSALFDDEPIRPSPRRPSGELRKQSRICTSCGAVVPAGMSLCNGCGLDLDTGYRIDLEDEEEEMTLPPQAAAGPPVIVLVIGLLCTMASGLLTVVSFFVTGGMGGNALGLISLYGVYASIMFTAGKSLKTLTIALMLGAVVNVITMIAVPVIVANTFDAAEAGMPLDPEIRNADPEDEKPQPEPPKFQTLSERMDMTKINWGIVILLVDAALLVFINTPMIRSHFEVQREQEDIGPIRI